MASPPPSMKALGPFLVHAQQLENLDPVMSYYCKYYAVQLGIKLRQAHPDEDSKKFLVFLMDSLEKSKGELTDMLDEGADHVRKFALGVFQRADDEDRSAVPTKITAKNFLAASLFFDVLSQFGPLTPELLSKQKYAKWKAADISNCLKRGVQPKSGPPEGEEGEGASSAPAPTQPQHTSGNAGARPSQSNVPNFPTPPSGGPAAGAPSFPTPPTFPATPSFPSHPSVPASPSFPAAPTFPTIPTFAGGPSFPTPPAGPPPPSTYFPGGMAPPAGGPPGSPSFPTPPSFPTTPSFPTPPATGGAKPPGAGGAPPSSGARPPQQPPTAGSGHSSPAAHSPSMPVQPATPPPPAASSPSPSSAAPVSGYKPSEEDLTLANKYAKFVVSSLQFDDVPSAIKFARMTLKHLTGSDH